MSPKSSKRGRWLAVVVLGLSACFPCAADSFPTNSCAEAPVLCAHTAKLFVPTLGASAYLGLGVAVWNDTAVIGAPEADVNGDKSGAAYVFQLHHGGAAGWALVTALTPSVNAAGDRFGSSVAIHGNTIVVGSPYEDGTAADSGAAFVFERNLGGAANWGQVRRLKAGDPDASDQFGSSVDVFDGTAVIGARYDDEKAGGAGAAYVFARNQGGADQWGQVRKIMALDGSTSDNFGDAVAIFGRWIAVGAYRDDAYKGSAYVFERNRGGADQWGPLTKILAPDGAEGDWFGSTLDLNARTLVVGAHLHDEGGSNAGAAYVFERNTGGADGWGFARKLTAADAVEGDWFGCSVALSGDLIVAGAFNRDDGAPEAGAAYLFKRNEGGADQWGQTAKLRAPDPSAADRFGRRVALCGNTVVCGVDGDDEAASSAGAARVFRVGTGPWGQVRKLVGSTLAGGDHLGAGVGLHGDTAAAGAPQHDVPGYGNNGAAYVFGRNEGGADEWGEAIELLPATSVGSGNFGKTVSVWGDRVAVGMPGAYRVRLYARNQGGANAWGEASSIRGDDTVSTDDFGYSVALFNDTLLVGAPQEDEAAGNGGAAYVFERNTGGSNAWGQVAKLMASDADTGDFFGWAVGLYGDVAVVGARYTGTAPDYQGAVYVFERNHGGADHWGQVARLQHSTVTGTCYFGSAVAVYGNTVAAGAPEHDGAAPDAGAVLMFDRNKFYKIGPTSSTNWGWIKTVYSDTAAADDDFGCSVSICRDTLAVGARYADGGAAAGGEIMIFERDTGGADAWGQTAQLWPDDVATPDWFGYACALDGNSLLGGAFQHDGVVDSSGAAYVFRRGLAGWPAVGFAAVTASNDVVHLAWPGTNGLFYAVQRSASLAPSPAWSNVTGCAYVAGTNATLTATDTNAPPSPAFYRLQLLP